jgi:thioredoxin reductase (NADPH)
MVYDVIVVGGGPSGLAAGVFATGRRLSTLVIDAQKLGGQLTFLYTTKSVYDYPSYIAIGASELGELFVAHAREAGCEMVEGEEVRDIERDGVNFIVHTDRTTYEGRTVILALGMGLFEPRRLDVPGELELEGRGVYYKVDDRYAFEGKRVLFVGGGDSALEMALNLVSIAKGVAIAHRREEFRAMEKNVEAVLKAPIEILWSTEVQSIRGNGKVEHIVLFNNRTGEETVREFEAAVIQIGLLPRVSWLKEWGIELVGRSIKVNQDMSTSVPGIFACGDIVTYEGKDKRIASGCGEAAAAAFSAYRYVKRPYWM